MNNIRKQNQISRKKDHVVLKVNHYENHFNQNITILNFVHCTLYLVM